ncbi:MAG TPA: FdtA/QdtA family cupin domain-containing protein [Bacteroidales bacterium]|nr:FdtA/QdtA family cupin domain-containing protein [Bacteroidales bacterium]
MAEPRLIYLPKILDDRGNLTFVEEKKHLPFVINRVYWIYDVPGGEFRGSHAFRQNQEMIAALSGSFDVVLHDGRREYRFSLNRSYDAVYVPSMVWRRMENFSTNSLAIVLASTHFDDSDYIRDYDQFLREVQS